MLIHLVNTINKFMFFFLFLIYFLLEFCLTRSEFEIIACRVVLQRQLVYVVPSAIAS